MSISLAMIVKNEEAVLERCLSSCHDLFDEIIIVDTGSADKSKEIAARFTDKVFDFTWINDFAAARNFSFSKATSEWIMWLDADDILKEEDKQKIRNLDFSDKQMIISDYEYAHDEYDNSYCTVPRERIVRRSLNLKWEGRIHETITLSAQIYKADFKIHHYKKASNSDRNLKILEEIVKENPLNARYVYYLGKEYFDSGLHDKSIPVLNRFVLKIKNGWFEHYYHAHDMLAQAFYIQKNEERFKRHIYKSLQIEDQRAEPYYYMGIYYSDKQQWQKAIFWYESCLRVKRPSNLLDSFRNDFYTWRPHLQLSLCYNGINDIKKAYEHIEKVLQYRPNDSMGLNNKAILFDALNKKKDGQGKKLNIGCGGKTMKEYINVDIFKGAGIDEQFELDNVPYQDNTISAIYSEHSLEHVTIDRANTALREYYRVLQPGGELILKIPDLEACCQNYLKQSADSYDRLWYKFTIFGIQKSQAGEPDDAQIHKSGFSKKEIEIVLERIGFVIDYSENYNGYDTPSVGIRALKPISNFKVGWIAPINWEAAQTRIRVLNIDRWLHSKGYVSKIVNYPEIINQNFDIAIVGKKFDENHYLNIKMLKQAGKTVFADLCEDVLDWPYVKDILAICDKVIVCSYRLSQKVESINSNVVVIEDAYET